MGNRERIEQLEVDVSRLKRDSEDTKAGKYIEHLIESKFREKIRQIIAEEFNFVAVKTLTDREKREIARAYEVKLKKALEMPLEDVFGGGE